MWDNHDPNSMGKFISKGQMPLTEEEQKLVARALDLTNDSWSVFDLYDLNVLCWMTEGYQRTN